MGYLNDEKATRETYLPGGFMRTGDQGIIDAEGMVTIADRLKEMIKVKGIAVAPAELEDYFLGHPLVEDCAVLGVPDEYSGERPKAFVVPKEVVASGDREEMGKKLLRYVAEGKVRRYKHLKEVEFVDVIPKRASGKISRRMLRNMGTADRGILVRDEVTAKAKL